LKKILVIIIFGVLLGSNAEAQCAMCRAVLESEENQTVAKGINNGIMYLMLIPYLLVGGIGYYLYRTYGSKK